MKNRKSLEIAPEILMKIDFENTVNGGSSVIDSHMGEVEAGYEITLKAPGIEADDMRIEVINDRLVIYHTFPVYGGKDLFQGPHQSIRMIGNYKIPSDADIEKVSAQYDAAARQLLVLLPYNEFQRGYRAKVTIEK